jgi:hypothetical protein
MSLDDVTISELARSLVRIEAKMDRSLDRIEQNVSRSLEQIEQKVDRSTENHESRILKLERIAWTALGLSAGSSGVGIWSLISG